MRSGVILQLFIYKNSRKIEVPIQPPEGERLSAGASRGDGNREAIVIKSHLNTE